MHFEIQQEANRMARAAARVAIGILIVTLAEDDLLRMHAENERILLDPFRKGIDQLYGIVSDFSIAK